MAAKIWKDLGNARSHGISRGEETITENFLLDVQLAHPAEVSTFQSNKREEAVTGADWEWWLTDGRQWLGLLIQAKILNPRSNLYSAIKHKVAGRPQIDNLINQAALKGIPAFYFFYNHTNLGFSDLSWKCGSFAPQIEQLGCTVADAHAVRPLVRQGGVGIITLDPVTLPLRCLVCCRGHARGPEFSLPERASGIARELISRGDQSIDVGRPTSLRDAPPSYVRELMSASPDERPRVIERLRSEVGRIGSLVVIKQAHEMRDDARGR
ncbi:MAG: hypothetical protein EOS26_15920 [Mesorhizobium sp.]|nr:MAG: hypothetical protein EOS26_15920 [Mesorhizobium sp.]